MKFKNISDLHLQSNENGKSIEFFNKFDFIEELFFFLGLIAVFIYGNLVRKSPILSTPDLTKQEVMHEVPEFARNIFATLDLNLDSSPRIVRQIPY
jgi:UDP-2,3-diacylglucosamine pyrophosphatase LpxH